MLRLRDGAKTCLPRGLDEETGIDERHRLDERSIVLGAVHNRLHGLQLLEDGVGLFGEDKGGELVVLIHVRVVRREELNDEAAGLALPRGDEDLACGLGLRLRLLRAAGLGLALVGALGSHGRVCFGRRRVGRWTERGKERCVGGERRAGGFMG